MRTWLVEALRTTAPVYSDWWPTGSRSTTAMRDPSGLSRRATTVCPGTGSCTGTVADVMRVPESTLR